MYNIVSNATVKTSTIKTFCTKPLLWLSVFCLACLMGCGFHLRGAFNIPSALQTLIIMPDQPGDPLQRVLRQTLKVNGIQIVAPGTMNASSAATLTILSQAITETVVAYGTDGQPNRAVLQLKLLYQIKTAAGKMILENTTVQVDRELALNPNAVLGTDNERDYIKSQLYLDAVTQLIRQISVLEIS